MIRGLKHVRNEERLKNFGFSNLRTRRSRVDLVAAFDNPKGEDGDRPLLKMCRKRQEAKGHKLQQGKFQLHIRKNKSQ